MNFGLQDGGSCGVGFLSFGGLFGVLWDHGPQDHQELIFIDFLLILGRFWEGLAPQEPLKILFLSVQMLPQRYRSTYVSKGCAKQATTAPWNKVHKWSEAAHAAPEVVVHSWNILRYIVNVLMYVCVAATL